ncbi:MAG: hypothetical protein CYG60_23935 [Actinobacteria bacterium]|nr:MAG: hypothetical protein CYG60_23935 [Actinomycetota bacterium]
MMDALVIYRYQAAGAEQGNEFTIRSDKMDVDLNRFQTSPHKVGDTVALQAEKEEEEAIKKLGEDQKEYVVRKCVHVLTQVAEYNPGLTVYVTVTDL